MADELIAVSEGEAAAHFNALRDGRRARDRPPAERAEAELVLPAGAEDPEVPHQKRLQGELARVLGAQALDELAEYFPRAADWPATRRIREQRDPTVCHEWLLALNPVPGPCLAPDEYVDAVRRSCLTTAFAIGARALSIRLAFIRTHAPEARAHGAITVWLARCCSWLPSATPSPALSLLAWHLHIHLCDLLIS